MTGLKKMPKVSIVCAWYNRADYIRDTVDSLLNQDFDDYEIIIANDGSPDPRVKEIFDSYDDPKLTIIHKENEGFTKTIKMLVENARAPFVAIQGAGDISYKNRLKKQYEYLRLNPELFGTGCWLDKSVVEIDGEETITGQHKLDQKTFTNKDFLANGNPYTQGEVMFVKKNYSESGGYRDFFKYAQDRDLWLRMSVNADAGVVEKVLYRRRSFKADGVSANFSKQVLQRKLSVFARYSAQNKVSGNKDLVDKYGCHALYYFKDNGSFKYFLHTNLAKSLINEDIERAKLIVEEISFLRNKNYIFYIFGCLAIKVTFLRSTLRLFFARKKFIYLED
jgi:glycosyltransferase involved in cell wall biosynthesis